MPYNPAHLSAQQDGLMAEVDSWPADGTFRLWSGDPTEDGVEVPAMGGYGSVAASGVSWSVVSGEPAIEATLDYTATDAWGDTANVWAFHDSDGTLRFYEELPEELDVEAAGPVEVTVTLFYVFDFEV